MLDRLASERPALDDVSIISIDRFAGHERFTGLGELTAKELASLWPRRRPVRPETTELARTAWSAFRAPDPAALAALAAEGGPELPFLAAALRRLLEELPAPADGLGRSERQILQAVADGAHTPREVFASAQAEEQAPFAGDWTIWWAIASLAAAPRALLHTADGAPLPPPPPARGGEAFLRSRIALTVDGEDVLAGRADQLGLRQVDRWVGGLELAGPSVWRYDAERAVLVAPEALDDLCAGLCEQQHQRPRQRHHRHLRTHAHEPRLLFGRPVVLHVEEQDMDRDRRQRELSERHEEAARDGEDLRLEGAHERPCEHGDERGRGQHDD